MEKLENFPTRGEQMLEDLTNSQVMRYLRFSQLFKIDRNIVPFAVILHKPLLLAKCDV